MHHDASQFIVNLTVASLDACVVLHGTMWVLPPFDPTVSDIQQVPGSPHLSASLEVLWLCLHIGTRIGIYVQFFLDFVAPLLLWLHLSVRFLHISDDILGDLFSLQSRRVLV